MKQTQSVNDSHLNILIVYMIIIPKTICDALGKGTVKLGKSASKHVGC